MSTKPQSTSLETTEATQRHKNEAPTAGPNSHQSTDAPISPHTLRAYSMWLAACPRSGLRPETDEEWDRVLRAAAELVYAGLVEDGNSPVMSRAFARVFHESSGARVFMNSLFDAVEAEARNAGKR